MQISSTRINAEPCVLQGICLKIKNSLIIQHNDLRVAKEINIRIVFFGINQQLIYLFQILVDNDNDVNLQDLNPIGGCVTL